MNILYLLKTLKTNKLSELVANIDTPPLDYNIAIWEAIDNGEIEINEKKDRVKTLKESKPWHNPDLAAKLMTVVSHYADNEKNITRGKMFSYIKDPMTGQGYPVHEYLMTLQYLIDEGNIVEESIAVPKNGDRPYHKFVFLCLPNTPNEEWNAKAVNKWLDNWVLDKA